MPPEETPAPNASQPAPESSSPTVEAPAPTEPAPAPETGPQGPLPVSKTDARQETQVAQSPTPTAQIPPNEPLPTEPPPSHEATDGHSEPFDSAPDSAKATPGTQDKPTPEPPSAAASAPAPVVMQTGIFHTAREFLGKARIAIQDRKRKKRDKIMHALTTKTKITNDEVEKLLHVSDATATRYLSALEKEGKIKQSGKTGHGVVYSKI